MYIPHIPHRHYETTVRGSAVRAVLCENCQTEFVYLVRRHGIGSGISVLFLDNEGALSRARTQAHADLQWELARAQDPVPCPECGWYQRSMIPLLRQAHRQGMKVAAMILLYFAAVFFLMGAAAWLSTEQGHYELSRLLAEAGAWAMLIGLALILTRKILAQRIRPNEGDRDARFKLARSLTMKKVDFERALHGEQKQHVRSS